MMMPKGGSFPAFAQLLARCGLCQFSGLDTLEKVVVDRSLQVQRTARPWRNLLSVAAYAGRMARYKNNIFYYRRNKAKTCSAVDQQIQHR